jgi:hypothetical protein
MPLVTNDRDNPGGKRNLRTIANFLRANNYEFLGDRQLVPLAGLCMGTG